MLYIAASLSAFSCSLDGDPVLELAFRIMARSCVGGVGMLKDCPRLAAASVTMLRLASGIVGGGWILGIVGSEPLLGASIRYSSESCVLVVDVVALLELASRKASGCSYGCAWCSASTLLLPYGGSGAGWAGP